MIDGGRKETGRRIGGGSTYTVDYLEAWINRNDNVETNAVAALSAMGVKGFYRAVRLMANKK